MRKCGNTVIFQLTANNYDESCTPTVITKNCALYIFLHILSYPDQTLPLNYKIFSGCRTFVL